MSGYKPTREQQILIGTGVPRTTRKEKFKRRARIARAARQRAEVGKAPPVDPKR